jgi:hypothetical protein
VHLIRNFLPLFFNQLNTNKIEYLILRGYEQLPNNFENDIDFFVTKDSLKRFYELIYKFSKNNQFIIDKDEVRQGLIKIQLLFIDNSVLKIDLFFEFRYAGLIYIDEKKLYKNRILFNNIEIANLEYEFYTSILKELLHNSRIRKDKVEKLKLLYSKIIENNLLYDDIINQTNITLIKTLLFSYNYIDISLAKSLRKDILIFNLKKFGFSRLCVNIISFFYIKYLRQNIYDKVIFTN